MYVYVYKYVVEGVVRRRCSPVLNQWMKTVEQLNTMR